MTAEVLAAAPRPVATRHRFLVLWQAPVDRSYHRVGTLERDEDGYHFRYTDSVAAVAGFEGFASFPDFERECRSPA